MCFKISQLKVNNGQTMEGKALSCATFILGKCADFGGHHCFQVYVLML